MPKSNADRIFFENVTDYYNQILILETYAKFPIILIKLVKKLQLLVVGKGAKLLLLLFCKSLKTSKGRYNSDIKHSFHVLITYLQKKH